MSAQLPELVGVYEIAHRLGVKVNTVQMWRRRDLGFPEPAQIFAMGPVWAWEQVDHWLEATGRVRVPAPPQVADVSTGRTDG